MANCKVIEDGTLFTRYQKVTVPVIAGDTVMEQLLLDQLKRKPSNVDVYVPKGYKLMKRNNATGVIQECLTNANAIFETSVRELADVSLFLLSDPIQAVCDNSKALNSYAIPFNINVEVNDKGVDFIPARVTIQVSFTPEIVNPMSLMRMHQNTESFTYEKLNNVFREALKEACTAKFGRLLSEKTLSVTRLDEIFADENFMQSVTDTTNDKLSNNGCLLTHVSFIRSEIWDCPGSNLWKRYNQMRIDIKGDKITSIQMEHDKEFHHDTLSAQREMRDNEKKYLSDLNDDE